MIAEIRVKSILNKKRFRSDWFLENYTLSPYSGCSFGCIYCYLRGSKYGNNLAKNVSVKSNAPVLLEKQLKSRAEKGEYRIIAMASSSDPYIPAEERLNMTGTLLEIILKYKFPVEVSTKSTLILRDIDVYKEIDRNAILPEDLKIKLGRGTIISFSISTLDEKITRILEPAAPSPLKRLEALRKIKENGLLAGVNYIPVLPFLSDSEEQLDMMIKTAREYMADFVFVGGLTLFGDGEHDSRVLYYNFLKKYYSELLPDYQRLYGNFFAPPRAYQRSLDSRANKICKKYGIKSRILE
jgi:DNA repair photolyase